jgi:hypothetical protein
MNKLKWLQENNILYLNYLNGDSAIELLQTYFCFLWRKYFCSAMACSCLASDLKCCSVCRCSNRCINKDDNDDNKDDLNE